MIKTRSVSAIDKGIVIDSISAGQALKIMCLLHLVNSNEKQLERDQLEEICL